MKRFLSALTVASFIFSGGLAFGEDPSQPPQERKVVAPQAGQTGPPGVPSLAPKGPSVQPGPQAGGGGQAGSVVPPGSGGSPPPAVAVPSGGSPGAPQVPQQAPPQTGQPAVVAPPMQDGQQQAPPAQVMRGPQMQQPVTQGPLIGSPQQPPVGIQHGQQIQRPGVPSQVGAPPVGGMPQSVQKTNITSGTQDVKPTVKKAKAKKKIKKKKKSKARRGYYYHRGYSING